MQCACVCVYVYVYISHKYIHCKKIMIVVAVIPLISDKTKIGIYLKIKQPRWFNVSFWSPSWRSLQLWKGHFHHPKKAQKKNGQGSFEVHSQKLTLVRLLLKKKIPKTNKSSSDHGFSQDFAVSFRNRLLRIITNSSQNCQNPPGHGLAEPVLHRDFHETWNARKKKPSGNHSKKTRWNHPSNT